MILDIRIIKKYKNMYDWNYSQHYLKSSFPLSIFEGWFDMFNDKSFKPSLKYPSYVLKTYEDYETIQMILPGFGKKYFDISIDGKVLKVSYDKPKDEENNLSFSFNKNFTLSNKIDIDKINSSMKNGVLIIELPHKEEEKTKNRKIEII